MTAQQSLAPVPNKHRSAGTWLPGKSGNPKGRMVAGQNFKDRLARKLEEGDIEGLRAQLEDKQLLKQMSRMDAIIARIITRAFDEDGLEYIKLFLDRLMGKPVQTTEVSITHNLADRLDQAQKILEGSYEVVSET